MTPPDPPQPTPHSRSLFGRIVIVLAFIGAAHVIAYALGWLVVMIRGVR